ncbi:hypothetical protein [Tenacibaculum piscium]|uniref:hypothetical protein n=1 Tax=Tenacibaculum piscium TaxID=1458515 RepID=UPI001F3502B6|nr:hypothetical protein [Tenacibaculum piscium]
MEESNNISKENLKEKASEFAGKASEHVADAMEGVKAKVGEVLSDETVQDIKNKAAEFADEAKETLEEVSEKASEFASKASEELADFAEDAQEEFKEVTTKAKKIIKDLLD